MLEGGHRFRSRSNKMFIIILYNNLKLATFYEMRMNVKLCFRNYLYTSIQSDISSKTKLYNRICEEQLIRVFIVTWNMNGHKPCAHFNQFLSSPNIKTNADIIIIGTQESYNFNKDEWENEILKSIGPSFILQDKHGLGKLQLALFLRKELTIFNYFIEKDNLLFSKYTIFKTKGAIYLSFTIFGTSFLFITSHLSPHCKHFQKRIKELMNIFKKSDMPIKVSLKKKHKGTYSNIFKI